MINSLISGLDRILADIPYIALADVWKQWFVRIILIFSIMYDFSFMYWMTTFEIAIFTTLTNLYENVPVLNLIILKPPNTKAYFVYF